jgi:hypothetical protein
MVQRQRHVKRLAQQRPNLDAGAGRRDDVVRPVRDDDVVVGGQCRELVVRDVLASSPGTSSSPAEWNVASRAVPATSPW